MSEDVYCGHFRYGPRVAGPGISVGTCSACRLIRRDYELNLLAEAHGMSVCELREKKPALFEAAEAIA